jgi:hypothetical protein
LAGTIVTSNCIEASSIILTGLGASDTAQAFVDVIAAKRSRESVKAQTFEAI